MVEVIYLERKPTLDPTSSKNIEEDLCFKFSKWLRSANPGDQYCYHKGAHVAGKKIAKTVFNAYERNYVNLFQKKEDNQFSYWAQKRR